MRVAKLSLCLVVMLGVFLARDAAAETAIAKRSARVFAERGEQSAPVTRVRAGKRMTVLQSDGRWVKVRVNGRTGWITRSNLVESGPEAPRERKRDVSFVEGRSRRDPSDDAPIDRIGADSTGAGLVEPKSTGSDKLDDPEDIGRAEPSTQRITTAVKAPREDVPAPKNKNQAVVRAGEAELLEKPNLSSSPVEFVEEGETVKVLEDQGEWTLVEHKSGTQGWVQSKDLKFASSAAASVEGTSEEPEEEDEPELDDGEPYKYEKMAIRAYAELGVSAFSQKFNSDGAGPLANYNTSASSVAVLVGGELIHDFSKKWLLGGDLKLSFARSMGGISYQTEKIGFSNIVADLGALAGYKFQGRSSGMAVYGRLAAYYWRQDVQGSSGTMLNGARIPSETLIGPKIGGVFAVPKLTDRFAVQGHLDFMLGPLLTSRSQSPNLEDGNSSKANALFLGGRVDYRWKHGYSFNATYDFLLAATDWSGAKATSMRGTGSTKAERTDMTHLLMFGASKAF